MSKKPSPAFSPMFSQAFSMDNNPFMDPSKNPFMDPSKNPFLSNDFAKAFQGFETPDVQGITETQRKNLEALSIANKTAAEGTQAVMQRQSEIVKSTLEEANTALQALQSSGMTTPDATAQIDQIKTTIESSVTNMRELSDMMVKSQADAFDIVNKRFVESLDEFKTALAKFSK